MLLSIDLVFPLCIQNGYLIFEALKHLVFALIVIIIIIFTRIFTMQKLS